MTRHVRKVGILGSGVMGSAIAAHFANAGIPSLVLDRFYDALSRYLDTHGRTLADYDGFVCHPGGAKVVAALERVMGLPTGTMREARSVLRDFGNMSAATVLFVLDRVLANGARGRYLMSALGPGFTAGFLTLEI